MEIKHKIRSHSIGFDELDDYVNMNIQLNLYISVNTFHLAKFVS